jgi:hypothetical protein
MLMVLAFNLIGNGLRDAMDVKNQAFQLMIQNQTEYIDFIKRRLEQTEGLLSVKQQQINTLLQITEAVNQNMPSEALFKIFEYVLRTQLEHRPAHAAGF